MKTVKQCDDTELHNKHEWFSETTSLNDSFECQGIRKRMKIIVTIDRPGNIVTDFEIGDMLETIRHSVELGGNTVGYLSHHDNAKWTLELEDDE